MRLRIREVITYEVEGQTAYEAMCAFLDDPSRFLKEVAERDVAAEDGSDVEVEVRRAERDS